MAMKPRQPVSARAMFTDAQKERLWNRAAGIAVLVFFGSIFWGVFLLAAVIVVAGSPLWFMVWMARREEERKRGRRRPDRDGFPGDSFPD